MNNLCAGGSKVKRFSSQISTILLIVAFCAPCVHARGQAASPSVTSKPVVLGAFIYGADLGDQWQQVSGRHFIVLYLRDEDRSVANTLLRRAEGYYRSIGSTIGYTRYGDFWTWEKRVNIYIFPDKKSFIETTGQPSWSIGYSASIRDAHVLQSRTIVTYKQEENFYDALLPHEISHLILHDFIPRGNLPVWLDEGVAQLPEQYKSAIADRMMESLIRKGFYIPFDILHQWDISTEHDAEKVKIFYAQSLSIVEFLIKKYGSDAFGRLCRGLRDGKSFEDALRGAYTNKINSLKELEEKWVKYMK